MQNLLDEHYVLISGLFALSRIKSANVSIRDGFFPFYLPCIHCPAKWSRRWPATPWEVSKVWSCSPSACKVRGNRLFAVLFGSIWRNHLGDVCFGLRYFLMHRILFASGRIIQSTSIRRVGPTIDNCKVQEFPKT